jgi:hypothetical protein
MKINNIKILLRFWVWFRIVVIIINYILVYTISSDSVVHVRCSYLTFIYAYSLKIALRYLKFEYWLPLLSLLIPQYTGSTYELHSVPDLNYSKSILKYRIHRYAYKCWIIKRNRASETVKRKVFSFRKNDFSPETFQILFLLCVLR